jgi:hypothetical protein
MGITNTLHSNNPSLRAKRSNLLRLPRRPAKAGLLAMTTSGFPMQTIYPLSIPPTHTSKISLCFFDGRPEAEIHRPEDDQASFDIKRITQIFLYFKCISNHYNRSIIRVIRGFWTFSEISQRRTEREQDSLNAIVDNTYLSAKVG